ncbi:Tubulin gamma-2 chain [Homalodisca vitripennis]|nr:Tubulin gamma-2 chain [Homalodisca vitripennis]KAG8267402.1 Tubulin gamma-2 chain [Homalodisca vitripennis]
MVHEILSFQIGQCGNSIGLQFWQNMGQEHGLNAAGELCKKDLLHAVDNKDPFFHQYESGRYVPRCIMLDLEPRVIQSIKNSEYSQLFEQRNMFVGEDGGGAGNNWSSGYMSATTHADSLMDLIRRETETMDLMEGSLITHGISGGTGSGMGSFILELLTDYFPKKTIQTYSVFPTSVNQVKRSEEGILEGQYGDIVIEPYNSLLTLLRLTSYVDSVVILDNLALHNLTSAALFLPHPSFANINKIVSDVMTASLAPIRYPSTMFNCLSDIVLSLTPVPQLHFLMTGYTPLRSFDSQAQMKQILKTSVESVMKRLGKMRNMMVSIYHPLHSRHGYISVFNVIQSNDLSESVWGVRQTVEQFRQRARYLPWAEPIYQTAHCPWSPYQVQRHRISGLTMTNHSSIVSFFKSTLSQFGKLYSRMAYVNQMQNVSGFLQLREELEECKLSCENLISEYEAALGRQYPKPVSEEYIGVC